MLYLLPNVLDPSQDFKMVLPKAVFDVASLLDGLFAESPKEGRKWLANFQLKKKLQEMPVVALNEHTKSSDLPELLEPLKNGEIWGLVSDCGLPCIGDPGARLVALCHKNKIQMAALGVSSAIIQALMLSGFSGTHTFHEYLPRDPQDRKRAILQLQAESKRSQQTQIFIETPYRTEQMFSDLLLVLADTTLLCVALDLGSPQERVIRHSIGWWKKNKLSVQDKRAVFLLQTIVEATSS